MIKQTVSVIPSEGLYKELIYDKCIFAARFHTDSDDSSSESRGYLEGLQATTKRQSLITAILDKNQSDNDIYIYVNVHLSYVSANIPTQVYHWNAQYWYL